MPTVSGIVKKMFDCLSDLSRQKVAKAMDKLSIRLQILHI
jgi:hypothetical protein